MDKQKKKELIQEYKDRKKEIGVIAVKCKATDEYFLGISTDINADFNSIKAKLKLNSHPNKKLLQLWKEYEEEGFEFEILEQLDYGDAAKDYTKELEDIREKLISKNENMYKIWK